MKGRTSPDTSLLQMRSCCFSVKGILLIKIFFSLR
ncbi:hypothetical protein SNOG_14752 [Parastagonospora nodorum SN15]|uniref:Uncharacterized protein n=1 Tax=Phaeosphaeria nodorum (strain SN15 / ATCC MYA-4574 / FGSC 10173) TaxID=321614 RepID=Q0U0N8_PHANO|nr:hypothetical protein SNOG_14752 [Parastagonospora nodorum SN15]EAT77944.1 hypothetical protein SNOG_14752 [Parastagonospora nodorum SN15]